MTDQRVDYLRELFDFLSEREAAVIVSDLDCLPSPAGYVLVDLNNLDDVFGDLLREEVTEIMCIDLLDEPTRDDWIGHMSERLVVAVREDGTK